MTHMRIGASHCRDVLEAQDRAGGDGATELADVLEARHMPPELWRKIFSLVDDSRDRASVASVCKQWRRTAAESMVPPKNLRKQWRRRVAEGPFTDFFATDFVRAAYADCLSLWIEHVPCGSARTEKARFAFIEETLAHTAKLQEFSIFDYCAPDETVDEAPYATRRELCANLWRLLPDGLKHFSNTGMFGKDLERSLAMFVGNHTHLESLSLDGINVAGIGAFPSNLKKLSMNGTQAMLNVDVDQLLKLLPPHLEELDATDLPLSAATVPLPASLLSARLGPKGSGYAYLARHMPPSLQHLHLQLNVDDEERSRYTSFLRDAWPQSLRNLSILCAGDPPADLLAALPVGLTDLALYSLAAESLQIFTHRAPQLTALQNLSLSTIGVFDLDSNDYVTPRQELVACVQALAPSVQVISLDHDEHIAAVTEKYTGAATIKGGELEAMALLSLVLE